MSWLALAAALVIAYWVWFAWDQHVRYGPVIVGTARWRRELPERQAAWDARQAEREALAALTPDDRTWLLERGWEPRQLM